MDILKRYNQPFLLRFTRAYKKLDNIIDDNFFYQQSLTKGGIL